MLVRPLSTAFVVLVAFGCAGGNVASKLVKTPEFKADGQTKCGVMKSQTRPLIVEWPSADRGDLEAQAKGGLVAVRYVGCEMEVLPRCRAPGAYGYTAFTRKDDRLTIRDADELYANVPLGAAKLEGKLASKGELNVTMTIVGKYVANRGSVRRDELVGDCAEATHIVASLTAGAFEFFAGADAEIGAGVTAGTVGGGAKSTALRELLNRDGDKAACDKATDDDKKPPSGCGALLRVEVTAVVGSAAAPPSVSAPQARAPEPRAPEPALKPPGDVIATARKAVTATVSPPAASSAPAPSPTELQPLAAMGPFFCRQVVYAGKLKQQCYQTIAECKKENTWSSDHGLKILEECLGRSAAYCKADIISKTCAETEESCKDGFSARDASPCALTSKW